VDACGDLRQRAKHHHVRALTHVLLGRIELQRVRRDLDGRHDRRYDERVGVGVGVGVRVGVDDYDGSRGTLRYGDLTLSSLAVGIGEIIHLDFRTTKVLYAESVFVVMYVV
jgi:hypothetical protein